MVNGLFEMNEIGNYRLKVKEKIFLPKLESLKNVIGKTKIYHIQWRSFLSILISFPKNRHTKMYSWFQNMITVILKFILNWFYELVNIFDNN